MLFVIRKLPLARSRRVNPVIGPIPEGTLGEMALGTVCGKVNAHIEFLHTGADLYHWRRHSHFLRTQPWALFRRNPRLPERRNHPYRFLQNRWSCLAPLVVVSEKGRRLDVAPRFLFLIIRNGQLGSAFTPPCRES